MASLKPNKPDRFDGKREEFTVRTWIYQVKQYLTLIQVGNNLNLTEEQKVTFAATYLSGTAAAWWYTRVASNTIPATIVDFENALVQEFVPFDSVQRSRDKLRRLVQRTSVSSYLSEFRNIVLMITTMSEGEKVDRFCQGLKPQVRLEVMKAGAQTMNDASRIALNVDAALFGAGMYQSYGFQSSAPTPMEIGNFEQRKKDRENNACYKCHKVGCRPYKCSPRVRKKASIGNTNVSNGAGSAGRQSEN